ncbi:LysR family transcriptional regulator, partial [Pandoraea nosoerga]|nr:LysR family transcriptional regulator [Pandoraea nosoerga]
HSDLQFAPRIRAVRAFLKNTLKQDPDMQVTLADALPQPRTADCKNP